MDNHLYLFIIWEQSRNKSEEIINDISSKFIIREIFEISWNKKNFLNNLIRFYGHSLPDPKKKTLLCGTGPFLLIIVQDRNPNFRTGIVFNGKITINDNIAKNKMKYREWVGEEFSIHGSISAKETDHNLTLLLRKPLSEIQNNLPEMWDGTVKQFKSDLIGCNGWKSIEEFLITLNGTINYVILRNFENFPRNLISDSHNDIDILTDGDIILPYICMTDGSIPPRGKMPQVVINQKTIPIDWKRPGDNFYDKRWYNDILKRRILHKNGFYIPSQEDYLYTLLYHMIFHKKLISDEYKKKILELAKTLELNEISEELLGNFNLSKRFIEKYMKNMKYEHPTSLNYRLKNNEFTRLYKISLFLLKTQGLSFLIKEFNAKIIRSISNQN